MPPVNADQPPARKFPDNPASVLCHPVIYSTGMPHVKYSILILLQVPLSDRLDDYVDDPSLLSKKPNLVPFPPDFEPIPAKPLFFDLALSHVEFPSLDDKLEQKKQGGGITGLVKGWGGWLGGWGGGSKQ